MVLLEGFLEELEVPVVVLETLAEAAEEQAALLAQEETVGQVKPL